MAETHRDHARGPVLGTPFMVELATGQLVPYEGPEWKAEVAWIGVQVMQMRAMSQPERTHRLRCIQHSDGPEMHRRVAVAYAIDWQTRKAAQQQSIQPQGGRHGR